MSKSYRRRVHERALKDTRHALLLGTREQIVITAAVICIALAAIWLFGEHEVVRGEFYLRVALTGGLILLFPFVYGWKLLGTPKRLDEDAAAETANLRAELQAVADQIANTLILTATVETEMANQSGLLEWRVNVKNVSSMPIQYGDIAITASLDGSSPIVRTGKGRILPATHDVEYKFPFQAKYEPREGQLLINVLLEYGLIGKPHSRRLTQIMRVSFQPRGAIAFSDCHNERYEDAAI